MPSPPFIQEVSTAKIWLSEPKVVYLTYTNNTGATLTNGLPAGTLLGQITTAGATSGNVTNCVSSNTDGSQQPRYLAFAPFVNQAVNGTVGLANGASVTIACAEKAEVNQNAIVLGGADTFSTMINAGTAYGGTIYSLLLANAHFDLFASDELTQYNA